MSLPIIASNKKSISGQTLSLQGMLNIKKNKTKKN